jgi:colicin import membrane protein
MKRLIIALLTCLPLAAVAQGNTWEQTQQKVNERTNPKYLAGAVPEVDGKVVFETTIKAPGKSKKEIYNILLDEFTKMTKEENQFEQSRIVLSDDEHFEKLIASYQEWLVFKNKPLELDRTRLFYNLMADIKDGEATVKMTRIYYLYDEERQPTTFQAEDWITDRYGLTKKKNKTSRVSGKFRRKTIDRKDYIFNKLETLLTK